jgi:hypothetical protein
MRTFRFVSALALAAGLAGASHPSAAQDAQRQPAQVPIDLATALVASPFTGGPGATRIFVGTAPNGLAASNLPPKPVSVLGGMATGAFQSVVLVYPATDPDPAASYMKFLEGAGWKRPFMQLPRGGFVATDELHFRSAALCRDSARATVLPISGAPSGSAWVRADFYPERGVSMCTERPRTDFMQEFVFPVLVAPPGSSTSGISGPGGSPDSRQVSTTLKTTLTAPQILAHYSAQLQKGGWIVGTPLTADSLGVERVTAKDTTGREWSGALTVVGMDGGAEVAIQMVRGGGR